MIVSICIKVALMIVGLFVIAMSVSALVKRSSTPLFTVIWVVFGVILIITGIFIEPYNWASILGLPTIALIGLLGLASIFFFWYLTKKLDELDNKMQEATIQLTLLNDENKNIKKQIKEINTEPNDGLTNKKILFVNNTLSTGGAEKTMLNLLEKYINQGNIVHLFIITGMGELVSKLPKGVKLLNKDFDNENVLSAEGKQKLVSKVLKAEKQSFTGIRLFGYQMRALATMIRDGKVRFEKLAWRVLAETAPLINTEYDLAIAFTEGASTYYVADRVSAKKKISYVHTPYAKAGYTSQLDRDCYNNIDEIYVVSEAVKESFLSVHPQYLNKVHIVDNPINYKNILTLSKKPIKWKSHNKILTVARLVSLKSYDTAIEAAKILKQKGYDFSWIALGEGEDHKKIQNLIDTAGLHDNFILFGNVDNPYAYMAKCNVYVHATSYEGKSIAVREAKSLGCAIILSNVSGNEGVIEDKVSGLYTNLDSQEIADKVAYLLDHKDIARSFGEAAKEHEKNQ